MRAWKSIAVLMAIGCMSLAGAVTDPSEEESHASGLQVTAHGVGTAVVDRRLEGESDRFPEGGRVFFWTRVEGGRDGDRIHHVWMRGGEEVLRVGLVVGGPHWRTWSNKMLHEGSAGEWAVEARDESGKVLARNEFTCE